MFKLMQVAAYWWPVTVKRPSETTPGELEECTLRVKYRYLKVDQHNALIEELTAQKEAGSPIDDAQFARRVVLDVADVVDEQDQAVAFSPELLDQLLNEPGEVMLATAITKGYFDSRMGVLEKN